MSHLAGPVAQSSDEPAGSVAVITSPVLLREIVSGLTTPAASRMSEVIVVPSKFASPPVGGVYVIAAWNEPPRLKLKELIPFQIKGWLLAYAACKGFGDKFDICCCPRSEPRGSIRQTRQNPRGCQRQHQ